jgi:hypothetical protein
VVSRSLPGTFCRAGLFLPAPRGISFHYPLEVIQGTLNKNFDLIALLPIPYAIRWLLFPGIFLFLKLDSRQLAGRNLMGEFIWILRILAPTVTHYRLFMMKDLFDAAELKCQSSDQAYFGPGFDYDDSVRFTGRTFVHCLLRFQIAQMRSDRVKSRFRFTPDFSFIGIAGLLPPHVRLSLSNFEMIETKADFRPGKDHGVFPFLVAIRKYCVSLRSFWLLLHPLMRRNC